MNGTIAALRDHWADVRQPGEVKTSPAIRAFREIMFMGRSAKVNLFGVAQMLSANTTGGPESRENFGIRCLARYTSNNWKMLADYPMPRASSTRGRWQICVAGKATEVQVAFLTAAEARALAFAMSPSEASPLIGADLPKSPGQPATGDTLRDPLSETLTLREAVELGIVFGQYAAAKRRLHGKPTRAPGRARSVRAAWPTPTGLATSSRGPNRSGCHDRLCD